MNRLLQNVLAGAGTVLVLWPPLRIPLHSPSSLTHGDIELLGGDFRTVGLDMRQAIGKLDGEIETQKALHASTGSAAV